MAGTNVLTELLVACWFLYQTHLLPSVTCLTSWAVTPEDAYVREGDTLTLNCSVNYSEHTSNFLVPGWTKRPLNGKPIDDIWIAINGTSVKDCCDVTGDKSKGESNLVIKRVTKESSGQWHCFHHTLRSATATITVIDPDDPVCTALSGIGRHNEVIENTEVTLRCRLKTENITPPGRLVWYRNGAEIHSGNSSLDIRTTITRDDHGVPFSCRLEHTNSSSSISCLNSITPDVQYPPLTKTPSNVCVKEGTTLTINCEYKPGNPTLTSIGWKIPGRESFTRHNPLIIDKVNSAKHSGVYTCKVNNTYFSGEQGESLNQTDVRVEYNPRVETLPVQRVKQGYDTLLQCDAKAVPDVDKFEWITPSGSVVNGRTLKLQNVNISDNDNGKYTCRARNTFCGEIGGFGHGSHYTYLDVLYRSKEVFLSGNTVMKNGGSLDLTCSTSRSNPASTITWYMDGSPLRGHHSVVNITTITEESSGHSGFITKEQIHMKLTHDDNAAKIGCSAKNPDFKDANDVFSKEIILSILFPPNKPKNCSTQLTTSATGNELVVNSRLTLQCTSCSSNPPADISWYMGGIEMKSSSETEHRQGYFHGTISEEKRQIKLTYKHYNFSIHCVANNRNFSEQTFKSQEIRLDVQYAPFPADEKYNRRVAVNVGENAILQCQMNGNPVPSIKWYDQHGNKSLPVDNRRYVREDPKKPMQESTLCIENVSKSDHGTYYCRGRNIHGDVEIVIVLSGKSAPDAVSDIEISTTTDITTVHWIAGFNGGDDQKFYVEYVKLPEGVKKTTELINDNELGDISVNISGLVAGSRYNITVVSQNDYGENRSQTLTARAEETSISAAQKFEYRIYIILIGILIVFAVMVVLTLLVFKNHRRKRKEPRGKKRETHHEDPLELLPFRVGHNENVEQRTGHIARIQDVRHQGPFDDDSPCDVVQPYENVPNVPERRIAPPFFTNGEERSAIKRNEEISAKSPKLQIQSGASTSKPASPESRRKSSTEDEDVSSYALLQNPVPLKENTSTKTNSLQKSKTKTKCEHSNNTPTKCKLQHVANVRGPYENLPSLRKVGSSHESPEGDYAATPLTTEQQSHFAKDRSERDDSNGNTYENLQDILRRTEGNTSSASDPRPELPRKKRKTNVEGLIYADLEHFGRKQPHTGRRRERKSDPVQYATIDHAKTSQLCLDQRERAERSHDENASDSSDNS
ncbi:nephrin-like [Ptychodera flava]|uniref:nephrin-like n=1 Tax=Ptychodera flava TaxID=63121 RepID=UPI00396A07C3